MSDLTRICPGLWHNGLKVICAPMECPMTPQLFGFAAGINALQRTPHGLGMLQGHPESFEFEFICNNYTEIERLIEFMNYPESPVRID